MTTAAPTAPATVHRVMPSFHALWEGAVNWWACGPVANEVAVAALENRTPDPGNALAAMRRDQAAGRFAIPGGQTLAGIAWDLTQRGYTALTTIPYSASPNLDALHQLVKLGGLNGWPVIFQVSRAYALPDNEAGVNYHFVVSGGIDSALGYLIANGDTRTGIAMQPRFPANTHIPLNWATWPTIEAAGICGAILVHPKGWTPPAPAEPVAPTTESVALTTIAALKAQFAQVQTLMAQLQAVLTAL